MKAAGVAASEGHSPVVAYISVESRREETEIIRSIGAWTGDCPACSYALSGQNADESGWIACPECGLAALPSAFGKVMYPALAPHPLYKRGWSLAALGSFFGIIDLVCLLSGSWNSSAAFVGLILCVFGFERSQGRHGKIGASACFVLVMLHVIDMCIR